MSNSYILKIFVEDPELKETYRQHIEAHSKRILEQGLYGDSGFDLLVPRDINVEVNQNPIKIDMEISCAFFRKKPSDCCCSLRNCSHLPCPYNLYPRSNPLHLCSLVPSAFYLYPRSSLYKSDLRLTNSVGIIDSGYRGHLAGVFDVVNRHNPQVSQYSRLLQICSPDLSPITDIQLVDALEELGETIRGGGGFGSTGK